MSAGDTKTEEMSEEEAAALAEWERMAAESQSAQQESKDLDQSEIDSLLGFEVDHGEKDVKGIKAMIDKALESYERFPMIEVVFEKFIRLLSTSLRNLTEDNVDLDIRSIQSMRFGTYINSIPIPTLVTVFKAEQWDHYGLFVANNALIFSLVDILFGGKKAKKPVKVEGRPYTSIEQSLVKNLSGIILKDLSDAFDTLTKITFKYERMESDPRFVSIARHADSAMLITIGVDIEDKRGSMDILFPYDAFEPIRHMLTQVFIGEQFGSDVEWQSNLKDNVKATEVTLEAVLDGKLSVMLDVMNMKVGTTVLMQNSADDDINIYCGGIKVSTGKLGKVGNRMAIALNKPVNIKENYND
jgi:flagellar motor switch protein FliM